MAATCKHPKVEIYFYEETQTRYSFNERGEMTDSESDFEPVPQPEVRIECANPTCDFTADYDHWTDVEEPWKSYCEQLRMQEYGPLQEIRYV